MIILGKNYQVNDDFIVIKPIGFIEENKLKIIEKEERLNKFPNMGRVHSAPIHRELTMGSFQTYEVAYSENYKEDIESSHFYEIKQVYHNANLVEIINVDISFEQDKDILKKYIVKGFYNKVETLPRVIIQTSDQYLLGPFNVSYSHEDYKVNVLNNFEIDQYVIDVYDNSKEKLNIASYVDEYSDITRSFSIELPSEKALINKLDIATDEFIVRNVLNTLRKQQMHGELTRKIVRELSEWINNTSLDEEINLRRYDKTIQVFSEIMPNERYDLLAKELLSVPSVNDKVNSFVSEKFKEEYEGFLQKQKRLLNKNEKLTIENQNLLETINSNKHDLQQRKDDLIQYKDFMKQKKKNIEKEFLEQYFNRFFTDQVYTHKGVSESSLKIIEYSNDVDTEVSSIEELKRIFKNNLAKYDERDFGNKILEYCLMTMKFEQPMILVGKSSYNLANIIKDTFSARKSRVIFIEGEEFSLQQLNASCDYEDRERGLTIIHNIHNSRAAFNLLPYIEMENKVRGNLIFTFDSKIDSKYLLEKLELYPMLFVEEKTFTESPFKKEKKYNYTQFSLKSLNDMEVKLDFEESVEEILDTLDENFNFDVTDIEKSISGKYRKLVYINQLLNNSRNSLSYFPFLIESLKADFNEGG